MKMKKILMAAAAIMLLMTTTMFTACTNDNEDNPTPNPSDASALVGTWYADLTGRTHSLWNYGTAWNVWTFKADGTGVCDVFYTVNDEPLAIEHQPFDYTIEGDVVNIVMADGPWDCNYKIVDGKLTLDDDGAATTFDKADSEQEARFDEWSQRDLLQVPGTPARYTVFVYGNAGGPMDWYIEQGFWERMKPLLTDNTNVRVVCFYKYGKDLPDEGSAFTGKYSDPGDIVWFELNSKTDLNKLRDEGLASLGFAEQAKKLKLCDPTTLRMFMEVSSLVCPAEDYIFSIWGHGSGFDPLYDVPGKYGQSEAATRGVIGDEWNEHEQLDMYELSQAIKESGALGRINTIFFHNCLMGNLETLTELRDVTDYICCSAHSLSSDGIVLSEFVRGLMEQHNTEDAVKQMFEKMRPEWDNQYPNDVEEGANLPNGDFKLLRTSKFDGILNASRDLATRLVELYPTKREAIDRATTGVYRYRHIDYSVSGNHIISPFFDLADYAHKLAEETADDKLIAISAEIDRAFNDLIIHYGDVNWNEQHLDHYTLSVCLYWQKHYTFDLIGAGVQVPSNICDSYEQSAFHKQTGWGNFLRINDQLPTGNPSTQGGGPLIK